MIKSMAAGLFYTSLVLFGFGFYKDGWKGRAWIMWGLAMCVLFVELKKCFKKPEFDESNDAGEKP